MHGAGVVASTRLDAALFNTVQPPKLTLRVPPDVVCVLCALALCPLQHPNKGAKAWLGLLAQRARRRR